MTNSTITHIAFLLDRSGSMQSIKDDTEGGFNAFIQDQRRQGGECRVTLAQFDNEYEEVYRDLPLAEVPPLRLVPRGSTALLDSIGRVSRDVVGSYNREAESRAIANDIQGAFATTALAEAGAIGLGTLVVTVVTGAAADVTGILLATALAVGGFYVLPRKRRQAQREFQRRIAELRTRLKEALTRQVHAELEQSAARINEAIGPYRRFVQSQQQLLNEARAELVATEDALLRLRADIEKG